MKQSISWRSRGTALIGLLLLAMAAAAPAQIKMPPPPKAPPPPTEPAQVQSAAQAGQAEAAQQQALAEEADPDWAKLEKRVHHAAEVLTKVTRIPEGGIPDGLLRSCQAVVVLPHVLGGAFTWGGRYGKGVMVHRIAPHQWSNPSFVKLIGGSWGMQIGFQNADLVLVIMNKRGMDALLKDKITLGGDASIAVGPLGRTVEVSSDYRFRAEILSYCRSRGLFAGISLQGADLMTDKKANATFYKKPLEAKQILDDPKMAYAPGVQPLIQVLDKFVVTQQVSPSYYKELEEKNKWPPPKKLPQPKLKI
jgi:lipid-binding SYLF domain-containing protein